MSEPCLSLETLEIQKHDKGDLSASADDIPDIPDLLPSWALCQEVVLPTEILGVWDELEQDLADYTVEIQSMQDPNLSKSWLPFFSCRENPDDGLEFPPEIDRLLLLMQRELKIGIPITPGANSYLQDDYEDASPFNYGFGREHGHTLDLVRALRPRINCKWLTITVKAPVRI